MTMQHRLVHSANLAAPLAFRTSSEGVGRIAVEIDERIVAELGNRCDTCPMWFASTSAGDTAAEMGGPLAASLRDGIADILDPAIDQLAQALPAGDYTAGLRTTVVTRYDRDGEAQGYFGALAVAYEDEVANLLPEVDRWYETELGSWLDPEARFGRSISPIGEALFPLMKIAQLDEPHMADLSQGLWQEGSIPTVWVLSILRANAGESTSHTQMQSIILDGHHRLEASVRAGRPISILSFVSHAESLATAAERDDWFRFASL